VTYFGIQGRSPAREGRMGTLTGLAVAMGLGGSSGCHQQIVQPDPERVALTVVNVNNPCTRVAFSITGNNSVTATMPSSTCGASPFKIVSGGPMTWKQNPNRLLKIPVRILNQDGISDPPYYVPRIVLSPDAKVVSNPAGTSPTTMVPLNADSTRADGTAVWLMSLPDSFVVELPGAFPPGATTHSRTLEFTINSPTIAGVFEFNLFGERFEVADTTRPAVPDSTVWPSSPLLIAPPQDTSYRYYRNVFEVSFHDSTSGSGVRNFLSHFSATIIGGSFQSSPNPFYRVQIGDPGNSWTSVDSIRALMTAWPGVWVAGPTSFVGRIKLRGRYPLDAAVATLRSAWTNPATTATWPWQAIRAPLAWGCEAGVAGPNGVQVAVVDAFFEAPTPADLASPISGGGIVLPSAGDVVLSLQAAADFLKNENHGLGIGGIIGASGNNGQGIAGMVWSSNLTLYALGRSNAYPRDEFQLLDRHLSDAATRGVKVVNISLAIGQAFDSTQLVRARVAIKKFLDGSVARLLVVAAGNDTLTLARTAMASSNDPRILATDRVFAELMADPSYRGKILFVTGVNRAGGRWADSLGGANVWTDADMVAAPAEGIITLAGASGSQVAAGTSFAAPFVTGLAAQLWTMRPQMSATQVKDYILRGAATSPTVHVNIGVQGIDRVDAYQSLTLVASENQDAPLCGNRVWVQNTRSIVVDRGTSIQTIFTAPSPDTLGVAFTRHGGRRIDFQILQQGDPFTGLNWSPGGWTTVPAAPLPDSLWSGTTWSFFRKTHDGDSVVGPPVTSFGGTAGASSAAFVVTLGTSSQSGRTLANMSRPLVAPNFVSGRRNAQVDSAGNFIQYVESTAPADQIVNSSFQTGTVRALPSPFGDRAIVVFRYRENPVGAPTAWAPGAFATPIGNEWSYQQRFAQYNTVSGDSEVWSIPWAGGAAQLLWTRPGHTVGWIGLSESPSIGMHEAVVGIGQIDQAAAPLFVGGYTTCNVEYVNALTGASIRSRTAPPVTCFQGQIEVGTIAPVRAAANQRRRN
jgi:hypothetical protein